MSASASESGHPTAGWLRLLLPVVFGSFLAAISLVSLRDVIGADFEQAALGNETTAYFAARAGRPIHIHQGSEIDGLLAGFRRRRLPSALLWLGNSQLHGINQYHAGQQSAPELLHDRLGPRGVDVVSVSPPNADLQEQLVVYEYLRTRLPLEAVLLPVVFDDLRETGVRGDLAPLLNDSAVRTALGKSEIGRSILERTKPVSEAADDLAGLRATVQERVERWFNDQLDSHWSLWRMRPQARAAYFVTMLEARNLAFGIDATTVRPMIADRYAANLAALEALLASARAAGTEVFVYVPPVRRDVDPPYDREDYDRFKQELAETAARYGIPFANLEDLVPGPEWGQIVGRSLLRGEVREYDFMHFQARAHQRLAEAVAELLDAHRGAPAP